MRAFAACAVWCLVVSTPLAQAPSLVPSARAAGISATALMDTVQTLAAIAAVTLVLPATATAPPEEKTGSLTQVGHEPLMSRGMNSAGAIHGDYMYIGSRTDGGHEDMPHGGVMIVDISDPSDPTDHPECVAAAQCPRVEVQVFVVPAATDRSRESGRSGSRLEN